MDESFDYKVESRLVVICKHCGAGALEYSRIMHFATCEKAAQQSVYLTPLSLRLTGKGEQMMFVKPSENNFSVKLDIPFDIFDDGVKLELVQWESVTDRGYELEIDETTKKIYYRGKLFRGTVFFPTNKSESL